MGAGLAAVLEGTGCPLISLARHAAAVAAATVAAARVGDSPPEDGDCAVGDAAADAERARM